MSQDSISQALNTALNAMSPGLETSWEGVSFVPTANPYQIVNLLFADTGNLGYGNGPYTESGYMQVKLMYPQGEGASPARQRAQLVRNTFYRGLSLTSGGITTIIERTPSISGGQNEDGRYSIIVKIRFFANIIP